MILGTCVGEVLGIELRIDDNDTVKPALDIKLGLMDRYIEGVELRRTEGIDEGMTLDTLDGTAEGTALGNELGIKVGEIVGTALDTTVGTING